MKTVKNQTIIKHVCNELSDNFKAYHVDRAIEFHRNNTSDEHVGQSVTWPISLHTRLFDGAHLLLSQARCDRNIDVFPREILASMLW